MERTGSLIRRLQELYESRASATSLLATAQLLIQELKQHRDAKTSSSKIVSVILPEMNFVNVHGAETVSENTIDDVPMVIEEPMIAFVPPVQKEEPIPEEVAEEKVAPVMPAFLTVPRFDEIPTIAYQQKDVFELNDAVAFKEESFNDRLKMDKKELGSMLKESPVKDLRKAIGINDRFVFINELFRGDEDMYERSIKTINAFNILPEAEYWIQRELKTKVGWNEDSETVQHFDQLVRRRFA